MNVVVNVTFVGLTVVFIALILLSLIITGFSFIIRVRQKIGSRYDHDASMLEIEDEPEKEADIVLNSKPDRYAGNVEAEEETIAAITAAIYLYIESRPGYSLRIKSIKRATQAAPVWNSAGRLEQVNGRL